MRVLLLFAILCLAGCHKDQPPAPSAEQADQLNEAEDMLNAMSANEAVSANEEGPGDQGPHQSSTLMGTRSTGPSNLSE